MTRHEDDIARLQQSCEALSRKRYELIRKRFDDLSHSLQRIHNTDQIDRMIAAQKGMNDGHNVVRPAARKPRWLPRRLYNWLVYSLFGRFVTPHLEASEQRQTAFNIETCKTVNELVAKMLMNEQVMLNYLRELNRLVSDIYTVLDMKISAGGDEGADEEPARVAGTLEQLRAEVETLSNLLKQMERDFQTLQQSPGNSASSAKDS